ncbi:hypothetical protein SDC9_169252 [bioreactor metagenome]|uniref:Uncharacterized protein n=1 Tax=bioreactor metagenome TaxID=1076179 RepID=A0A645G7B4_9ZZZZ
MPAVAVFLDDIGAADVELSAGGRQHIPHRRAGVGGAFQRPQDIIDGQMVKGQFFIITTGDSFKFF